MSRIFPGVQAAIVSITTDDGVLTERVDFPKGEPENPLTDEEFRTRYDGLMAYGGIDAEAAADVFALAKQADASVSGLVTKL